MSLLGVVLSLTACGHAQYYAQAAAGQLDLLSRRQSIAEVVDDPDTPQALRERLRLVLEIRAFAERELHLPGGGSYTSYADLQRPYVVWAVFAAPEFSLSLKQWCYPIVGCAVYRGYFAEAAAQSFARELRSQGYEAYVRGAPAYSTLGWFDDPVLSTVMRWPEPNLAGLIFHELTHERLYVQGDSMFNESLARAVEVEGVRRWMELRNATAEHCKYLAGQRRYREFTQLVEATRERLAAVYAAELNLAAKRAQKRAILGDLREQYAALRQRWSAGENRLDRWFVGTLNNAQLGAVATYEAYLPAFHALLLTHRGDLRAFFTAAERLGALPAPDRTEALAALAQRADDGSLAAQQSPCESERTTDSGELFAPPYRLQPPRSARGSSPRENGSGGAC